jgi:hypothetical protein
MLGREHLEQERQPRSEPFETKGTEHTDRICCDHGVQALSIRAVSEAVSIRAVSEAVSIRAIFQLRRCLRVGSHPQLRLGNPGGRAALKVGDGVAGAPGVGHHRVHHAPDGHVCEPIRLLPGSRGPDATSAL